MGFREYVIEQPYRISVFKILRGPKIYSYAQTTKYMMKHSYKILQKNWSKNVGVQSNVKA